MKIQLHSNRTVEEIGEEFNHSYPYLKIVFVTRKVNAENLTVLEEIDSAKRLAEISEAFTEGDIDIRSTDTVKEIEQRFERQFGLPVHIFRKQKGVWMDTNVTDDLTLHEQNTWGREASKPLKIKLDDHLKWNNFSLGK